MARDPALLPEMVTVPVEGHGGTPAPSGAGRNRAWGAAALVAVLAAAGALVGISAVEILFESLQFAVFACATNILVGYGGLVSFGQGAFYGTGAYVIALTAIHWHLSFWLAFAAAPFVAAGAALLVGLVAMRTQGLYFALLSLAFAQLFYTVALLRTGFTKGSTGIFGNLIPSFLANTRDGYYFTLGITALALWAMWWIMTSPFGLTLKAIRENRGRAEALGVNVFRHQLAAFVISGFFCGLAGVLFVVYDNAAYPSLLNWIYSGYPVFMAVIGGMFVFLGPALGALVYTAAYTIINQHTTDWELIFGALLLLVALFVPDGLVGLFRRQNAAGPAWRTLQGWLSLGRRSRK